MGEINQDPSMEEILASIKRVINEDGKPGEGGRSQRTRRTDPEMSGIENSLEDEEDVLELEDELADDESLMSEERAAASRQSLAALAAVGQPQSYGGPVDDSPLEAMVKDMLRPLLKQWLDERLPEMVEEMVAREIARITGKRL
jgi:cell pole-organizing protein PopZ